MKELTLEKFEEAAEIVKNVTLETKLVYSEYFSGQSGNKVYIKPENMQYTGAYKVRGAYYKISTLTEEERSKGTDYGFCREPCPGCRLCCEALRRQSYDCDARFHPSDEGEPHKELWGGGGALRQCL